jgi:hypothetical protein
MDCQNAFGLEAEWAGELLSSWGLEQEVLNSAVICDFLATLGSNVLSKAIIDSSLSAQHI